VLQIAKNIVKKVIMKVNPELLPEAKIKKEKQLIRNRFAPILSELSRKIPQTSYEELQRKLGFDSPYLYDASFLKTSLQSWKMQIHDAPILGYIFRNFKPNRHLEFGTWKGEGVVLCLKECSATVWTMNLWEGEPQDGPNTWAYSEELDSDGFHLGDKINTKTSSQKIYHQSDSYSFIGRQYKENNLGNRVCQIYCDSREWDTTNYPQGFFDTCLIDGGHTKELVINDTYKALPLIRSGGIVMWHDFCPDLDVITDMSSPRGVCEGIIEIFSEIRDQFSDLFWIYPSWILVGIKK
jgi:hypothetical protein